MKEIDGKKERERKKGIGVAEKLIRKTEQKNMNISIKSEEEANRWKATAGVLTTTYGNPIQSAATTVPVIPG